MNYWERQNEIKMWEKVAVVVRGFQKSSATSEGGFFQFGCKDLINIAWLEKAFESPWLYIAQERCSKHPNHTRSFIPNARTKFCSTFSPGSWEIWPTAESRISRANLMNFSRKYLISQDVRRWPPAPWHPRASTVTPWTIRYPGPGERVYWGDLDSG